MSLMVTEEEIERFCEDREWAHGFGASQEEVEGLIKKFGLDVSERGAKPKCNLTARQEIGSSGRDRVESVKSSRRSFFEDDEEDENLKKIEERNSRMLGVMENPTYNTSN
jgi:hypothetical protein